MSFDLFVSIFLLLSSNSAREMVIYAWDYDVTVLCILVSGLVGSL